MMNLSPGRPLRQAFLQVGRETIRRLIAVRGLLRQKLEHDGGNLGGQIRRSFRR